MATELLFIRHGETDWNRENRIQGHRDVPLSPRGERQAALLGRRLRGLSVDGVYSSDSARARRTAELAFGPSRSPALDPALRERGYGDWEGLTWDELRARRPEDAKSFQKDPVGFPPPGGETWNQMRDRVFQKVTAIAAAHPGRTAAVFTHGGPIKAVLLTALNLPPEQWRIWVAANASVSRLRWDPAAAGTPQGPWRLLGFNDTAHLEGTDDAPAFAKLDEKGV